MKKLILFPIITGFAAAIIVLSFLSQESISKNIGIEKEYYDLGFTGIDTYHEGDLVKIKMLLSGYGSDCGASFLMEIHDTNGDVAERNGFTYACTGRVMKKMDSVEVLTIASRLEAGKYFVFGQFSPHPDEYFTKIENFTVAKIDQTGLSYPIEPTFGKNNSNVIKENFPKIRITVNDNIPTRKIVPISVFQVSKPENNEITFWGFSILGIEMSNLGKTWGNLPNPTEFRVTDKNENDVLDRSHLGDGMFYFPLSLVYYPATCGDGSKVSAEAILPTKVPVNATGQVSSGSTTLGLYPNEEGIYYLEFAAPFKIDLELGKNIKPYSQEHRKCVLDQPKDGFESLYHLKFWFEVENQI